MRYRKKPVVIEAIQMTADRWWDPTDWPVWLVEAYSIGRDRPGSFYRQLPGIGETEPGEGLYVHTLEGEHRVRCNDWIIQGVKGELYPCKDEIFRMTYDPVEGG